LKSLVIFNKRPIPKTGKLENGGNMNGLPSGIDLSFFHKKTLLQVCIGANDLILNFDEFVKITITSHIGWTESWGTHDTYESFRNSASVIVNLLGKKITSVTGDDKGTLSLTFDGGGCLSVYDDSKQYESYVIKNGDKLIVV